MKKKLQHLIPCLLSFLTFSGVMISCEKYLEVQPQDVLMPEQVYRDKFDADAAVRGIYGKLINLSSQYVIMNELRADLMDVTYNADYYLRQVNLHRVESGNPYTSAQPFYSLINDCNDALSNFDIMLVDLKFSREEYDQRYSDIATLRSWLYFQLVIHFGNVPYITTPIDRIDDIKKLTDGTFPVLSIEQMVDTLITFMESLPYKSGYTDPSLLTTIDGYSTRVMFIDKEFFLGDLYLWNDDYLAAASTYKLIMERNIGENQYDAYKVCYGDVYTLTRFNSGYYRYYWYDRDHAINNWPTMFSVAPSSDYFCEWIWVMYFHPNYDPINPFIGLFSNTGGKYYLKPSQLIMDDWDAQVQNNEFRGDFRGNTGSYQVINNEPVIMKFISNYSLLEPFNKSGKWFLWRAAQLHLRFIEAATRDGQFKVAYSLLNNGIRPNYYVSGLSDITNTERTLLPFPYDFNAQKADVGQIPPGARGLWHRNTGIRGRVYLQNLPIAEGADSLIILENQLIDEAARELAFEGHRWGDLVRIAIRRNDPAFLADRIYAKLEKAGYAEASEVHSKLMDRNNWFLPLGDD
jgi:hypothetical protein